MQRNGLINYWNPGSFFDNVRGLYFDENANGGGNGAGAVDGGNPPQQPPMVQHTQAQLDSMFADRAKRGGEAALGELYKELGVKDADELRALYAEGKKLKESQLSDLEKLKQDKETADKALADEKTGRADDNKKFVERLLKAEIQTKAKAAGFLDEALQDVWMLINAEHRTKITEKDDSFEGIDKVLDEIKKARAHWLAKPGNNQQRKSLGSPRHPARKLGDGQPETPKSPSKSL